MGHKGSSKRRCKARFGVVTGVLLWSLASGCSFVYVPQTPEHPRARARGRCNDSYEAPVADTILASGLAVAATALAVSAANARPCDGWCPIEPGGIEKAGAVVLGVPAVLHGISAGHGYVNVSECRDLDPVRESQRDDFNRGAF